MHFFWKMLKSSVRGPRWKIRYWGSKTHALGHFLSVYRFLKKNLTMTSNFESWIFYAIFGKGLGKPIYRIFESRFFRLRVLGGQTNIRNRLVWPQMTSQIASIDNVILIEVNVMTSFKIWRFDAVLTRFFLVVETFDIVMWEQELCSPCGETSSCNLCLSMENEEICRSEECVILSSTN